MQWQWPCRHNHHLHLEHASNVCGAACAIYYSITLPLRLAFVPDFCLRGSSSSSRGLHHVVFIILDVMATVFLLWKALDVHVLRRARSEARVAPIMTTDSLGSKESKGSRRRPRVRPVQLRCRSLMSASFLFAFLSALPLEYVALIFSGSGAGASTIPTNYLLLNRTLMLFDLPRHLSNISSLLEQAGILKNIGVHRAWKLFFAMALAGHWCGCGFYLVAKSQAVQGNPDTWPEDMGIYQHANTGTGDESQDGGGGGAGSVLVLDRC